MEGTRDRPPSDDGGDQTVIETSPDEPVLVTDHDTPIPLPWKCELLDKAVGTKDGKNGGTRILCEAGVQTNLEEEYSSPTLPKKAEAKGSVEDSGPIKITPGQSEIIKKNKIITLLSEPITISLTQKEPEVSSPPLETSVNTIPSVTGDVDVVLDQPPVAPPRKSPSKRKRLLGKRARKRTGGETGEGIKKIDPTTSEEEVESKTERPEDRWKREDDEKRKNKEKREEKKEEEKIRMEEEKKRREEEEQRDLEEWTELLRRHKAASGAESSEPEDKTLKDKTKSETAAHKTTKDKTDPVSANKKAQKDKSESDNVTKKVQKEKIDSASIDKTSQKDKADQENVQKKSPKEKAESEHSEDKSSKENAESENAEKKTLKEKTELEKKAQKDKTEVKKSQEKKDRKKELALVKTTPLQPPILIEEERGYWWKFWRRSAKEPPEKDAGGTKTKDATKETKEDDKPQESNKEIYKQMLKETWRSYKEFQRNNQGEWNKIVKLGNKCLGELFIVIMLCGAGAFIFRFTEATFENFYKCGVKRVKRDFIDELWKGSTYLQEEEWKSKARRKLMDMEEQLQAAFDASVTTYSGHKSWSFINSLLYSLTVITTIGYGHIAPATTTGKALTIVYAVIGIPMFLILLADFGKLFTRGIKWVWAFVRRLYYTGSCKKVRKTAPVQEVMKGVQLVYDMAAFRRPSSQDAQHREPETAPETVPSTPAPSNFEIDEEFNLPITLAIFILVLYIFCGAVVFWIWEDWSFFDAFYFVFISMSTIGFGDLVPQNKMYMMASIVYLAFGLALTSMCINVVQEKLSDTFRQASAKIGATIGLKVKGASVDQLDMTPGSAPVELALVHKTSTPSAAAV